MKRKWKMFSMRRSITKRKVNRGFVLINLILINEVFPSSLSDNFVVELFHC